MSVKEYAVSWGTLEVERNYLVKLLKGGKLNAEQEDFVQGFVHHLSERMESLEGYILDMDEEGSFYDQVRDVARTLNIKPSKEFLNNLNNNFSTMQLDGIEFDIKKAVEKYNNFYYSCAIYLTKNGHVGFSGCSMEDTKECKVLFTKGVGYKTVTIQDVKAKIEKLKNTDTRTIEDVREILSMRSYNILKRAGYNTVQQIKEASLKEIQNVRNLGMNSLEEIQEVFNIKFA